MKARGDGAGGAEELPRWDDEGSDGECVEITDDAFAVRGVSYAALHALDALVPDADDSHNGDAKAAANTNVKQSVEVNGPPASVMSTGGGGAGSGGGASSGVSTTRP